MSVLDEQNDLEAIVHLFRQQPDVKKHFCYVTHARRPMTLCRRTLS